MQQSHAAPPAQYSAKKIAEAVAFSNFDHLVFARLYRIAPRLVSVLVIVESETLSVGIVQVFVRSECIGAANHRRSLWCNISSDSLNAPTPRKRTPDLFGFALVERRKARGSQRRIARRLLPYFRPQHGPVTLPFGRPSCWPVDRPAADLCGRQFSCSDHPPSRSSWSSPCST